MDLSHIFKSKTRQAIFKLYFSNPDGAYYLRELERLLSIPVSMVRKELLRLQREGSFLSERKGNLSYFCLNKSYPFFEELKSIVHKSIGIEEIIEEALKRINGIESAYIYGPFVKNKVNPISEINLFIVGKPRRDILLKELGGIRKLIKREINYNLYTKDEFDKRIKVDTSILNFIKSPKISLKNDIGKFAVTKI